ncbi:MAG: hypothetical protein HS111_12110 [Kofleriaceae bacterium]|nr:hypothetical protein [Kofleriaceae bacterium]MCL4227480.1 hypothetical protein [Myxococcales bacterium]
MTLPRQVIPGSFYKITRRCTQRQYLLHADEETNQIFLYCLAEAAQRFQIEVILPVALSNHHHTDIFDRHGNVIPFVEHFHKLLARAMNEYRGRSENFWSSEQVSIVRIEDPAEVVDKVAYTALNPVKAGLVERAHHWPGVSGLSALLNGRAITVKRPRHFFRAGGVMPETATLELVVPPELGDADAFRARLRERVALGEQRLAEERARTGKRVLGRRAVLRQSWRSFPTSEEVKRDREPRFAASDRDVLMKAIARYHDFLDAYREARARWLSGLRAVFPAGTCWLRRFANVAVAPLAPS